MSTPTEHDTEALARVILPALPNHCCVPGDLTDCPYDAHDASGVAQAILTSDWLAQRDAALIAKAKAEGAVEALRAAADMWQSGEWTAITATVRLPRPEGTLSTAQVVTDWLRHRAAAIEAGQ